MMRYDVVKAVTLETVCDVLGSAIFELHGKRKYGRKLFERALKGCGRLESGRIQSVLQFVNKVTSRPRMQKPSKRGSR